MATSAAGGVRRPATPAAQAAPSPAASPRLRPAQPPRPASRYHRCRRHPAARPRRPSRRCHVLPSPPPLPPRPPPSTATHHHGQRRLAEEDLQAQVAHDLRGLARGPATAAVYKVQRCERRARAPGQPARARPWPAPRGQRARAGPARERKQGAGWPPNPPLAHRCPLPQRTWKPAPIERISSGQISVAAWQGGEARGGARSRRRLPAVAMQVHGTWRALPIYQAALAPLTDDPGQGADGKLEEDLEQAQHRGQRPRVAVCGWRVGGAGGTEGGGRSRRGVRGLRGTAPPAARARCSGARAALAGQCSGRPPP